jgi:hypothetical protein
MTTNTVLPIGLVLEHIIHPACTFMTMMYIQSAAPSVDSTTPASPRRIGETSTSRCSTMLRRGRGRTTWCQGSTPDIILPCPAELLRWVLSAAPPRTKDVPLRKQGECRRNSIARQRASQEEQASWRVYMITDDGLTSTLISMLESS